METDKDIIFASSFYLTKELPKNWSKWSNKKLNEYLEDHSWQPFQYDEADTIFDHISCLANSLRSYINKESATK
jgi:hypothetical protein